MSSTKWLKVHSGSSSEISDEHIKQYWPLILTFGGSVCYAVPPGHWAIDYLPLSLAVQPTSNPSSSSFTQPAFPQLSNESPVGDHVKSNFRDNICCCPLVSREKVASLPRCDVPVVKPCWLIPTAAWYFMSLKMDSQGMCCAILAAQGTGRRLTALVLPRSSFIVSLFPIIREVSVIFCWWSAAALHSHHPPHERPPAPTICEKTVCNKWNLCSALIYIP